MGVKETGEITVGKNLGIAWDFDEIALYEGSLSSRTTMSGEMTNIYGNYGTWSGEKGACRGATGSGSHSASAVSKK